MKRPEVDIIRATESEIVLSATPLIKWLTKGIALMVFVMPCSAIVEYYEGGDSFLNLGSFLFSLVLGIVIWQMLDFTTVIQFNRPRGYLTIKESPWWSIFIPFGHSLFKRPTQVPLPKREPFIEDHSGTMTYPVQTGPDTVEIQQSYVNRFQIQLPLDNGKHYHLWTTSDRNTYIEIIRRINQAVQDFKQG